MTKIINLYGGPCIGKSTVAAELYAVLKKQHKNVELVREYPKDLVWANRVKEMQDQIYILGKHWHTIWNLLGKVEYIISDSPLLLQLHYGKRWLKEEIYKDFQKLVLSLHRSLETIDILLIRNPNLPFQEEGRIEGKDKALIKDSSIAQIVEWELEMTFRSVLVGTNTITKILDIIEENNAH